MDKTTKIVIGVAGGIIVLCICAAVGGFLVLRPALEQVAEDLIVEDPEEVRAMAEDMATYTLPPGYQAEIASNMFGIGRMIIFNTFDTRPTITFWEINPEFAGDEEEIQAQMEESLARQTNTNDYEMTLKEERNITISGKETTLSVYEGTDGTGETVRQWLTTFEGKNAPVAVMIMGTASDWNDAELTAFLESIR